MEFFLSVLCGKLKRSQNEKLLWWIDTEIRRMDKIYHLKKNETNYLRTMYGLRQLKWNYLLIKIELFSQKHDSSQMLARFFSYKTDDRRTKSLDRTLSVHKRVTNRNHKPVTNFVFNNIRSNTKHSCCSFHTNLSNINNY